MQKLITLVSPILVILTIGHTDIFAAKSLFMGSIHFPKSITKLPQVRIRCAGNKIDCESQESTKTISFTIPEDKRKNQFHILISETISFKKGQGNTFDYQKANLNKPYRFFTLYLLKKESYDADTKQFTAVSEWKIDEQKLALNEGQIPDDTIFIRYNPKFIARLEGGSALELPKIIIKEDILALAGSEENLHESSIQLVLSSLDSDTIHSQIKPEIKQDYQHRRVTIVT